LSQEIPIIKKGVYYTVRDAKDTLIVDDRTKRGLTVRETSVDEKTGILADKGMIHDMDGIGHLVVIRWHFPKSDYDLTKVVAHAEAMEKRYTELRELTCPDDPE
jgi:hypothetical protein